MRPSFTELLHWQWHQAYPLSCYTLDFEHAVWRAKLCLIIRELWRSGWILDSVLRFNFSKHGMVTTTVTRRDGWPGNFVLRGECHTLSHLQSCSDHLRLQCGSTGNESLKLSQMNGHMLNFPPQRYLKFSILFIWGWNDTTRQELADTFLTT